MAIKRPLCAFASDQLKEMTDDELDNLSYNFRVKWASLLKAGHDNKAKYDASVHASGGTNPAVRGNLFFLSDSGNSFSNPDTNRFNMDGTTTSETMMNMTRSGIADNNTPSTDIPSDPAGLSATTNMYRKALFANFAASLNTGLPGHALYNNYGYLIWNSGGYMQIDSDSANIVDTVLKHVNNEMLNGDEVGTYRVSTSAPTSGGAGTWAQIGSGESEAWYYDTISSYTGSGNTIGSSTSSTQTIYYLWLKENLSSFAGVTDVNRTQPVGWKASTTSINRRDISTTGDLINQILLPIYNTNPFFTSGNFAGYPRYYHSTSNSVTSNQTAIRGTFHDTRLDSNSIRGTFGPQGGTYYKERYATGTATTVLTFYLIMSMGDSTDYIRT